MKKYKAIHYATSIGALLILSVYIWFRYSHPTETVTIWNTAIPAIGSLVLLAATLVTSALAQEETAQAAAYVDYSEYAEIDDNGEVTI